MENAPLILAIDTSAGRSSVALCRGAELIAEDADAEPGRQSRTLVLMVEGVLAKAGLDYADCDLIACAVGPGGFTSVRVGLAAARAMALAADKKLAGISSLEAMAAGSGLTGDVVAVIDAHRGQFYAQRFRVAGGKVGEQSPPVLAEEAGLKALCHGARRTEGPVTANLIAARALARWQAGEREFSAEPLYIREPDAKLPA